MCEEVKGKYHIDGSDYNSNITINLDKKLVVNGNLSIQGNLISFGKLVVRGNLIVSGADDNWKGILKVRGEYFGTGKQMIIGKDAEDKYEDEDKSDLG